MLFKRFSVPDEGKNLKREISSFFVEKWENHVAIGFCKISLIFRYITLNSPLIKGFYGLLRVISLKSPLIVHFIIYYEISQQGIVYGVVLFVLFDLSNQEMFACLLFLVYNIRNNLQRGCKKMKEMKDVRRIVVKVGSSTLTHPQGGLHFQKIDQLAMALSDIKNSGKDVILVSSGAVSAGVAKLQMRHRPTLMKEKQAAASVGQSELMFIYDKFFSQYGQTIAQLLLTKTITHNETLRMNAVNTLETLLSYGVIPIVNENDSVATDEIAYGDNDTLSAVTAYLTNADLLILLSDIDGLYDDNPTLHPNAKLIPVVNHISEEIQAMAKGAGSKHGTGGMVTKLYAAQYAGEHGIPMIIANGNQPSILYHILKNTYRGTLFDLKKEENLWR